MKHRPPQQPPKQPPLAPPQQPTPMDFAAMVFAQKQLGDALGQQAVTIANLTAQVAQVAQLQGENADLRRVNADQALKIAHLEQAAAKKKPAAPVPEIPPV